MFARANDVMAERLCARHRIAPGRKTGTPVTEQVSAGPELMVHPIFEDINIYQLDARIRGLASSSTVLPPPRSTIETLGIAHYHLNFKGWPTITGLFEGAMPRHGVVSE